METDPPAMRLGFDARMYGLEHAGIGRYTMNLLDRLVDRPGLDLTIFISPKYAPNFSGRPHLQLIPTAIRHYSLKEQTQFLQLLQGHQFDLLHVPHFNLPLLYRRPFVVTIHDILWHQVRGAHVTTLSPLKYYLKYQGYKLAVAHAVGESRAILVPSNYVKQDLKATFPRLKADKIHVTYEGISLPPTTKLSDYPTTQPSPYLVYVGSAYPHKNLTVLLKALTKINLPLKIVGSRSIFLDQIRHQAEQLGILERIDFVGSIPDPALTKLLAGATALVHPSKSEGFGLTGLEAMAAGCPVISASATALPEIYGTAALYFDPDNPSDLIAKIDTLVADSKLRSDLITKGFRQVKGYSWDKMVDQTLDVYKTVLSKKNVIAGSDPQSTKTWIPGLARDDDK